MGKSVVIVLLSLACICLVFADRCNTQPNTQPSAVDSIIREKTRVIDSIKNEVAKRDSIIASRRDSFVVKTKVVKERVVEYRSTTDTATKVEICDSVIAELEWIVDECNFIDSVRQAQENGLKMALCASDQALQVSEEARKELQERNERLEKQIKRHRKTTIIAALSGLIAGFTVNYLR